MFFAIAAVLAAIAAAPSARAQTRAAGRVVVSPRIDARVVERAQSGLTIPVFIVLAHQPQREVFQQAQSSNALYRQLAESRYRSAIERVTKDAEELRQAREGADAVLLATRRQAFQAIDQAIGPEQTALETKLKGLGAARIARYRGINMLTAEIPASALGALEADGDIAQVFAVERYSAQIANSVPDLGAPAFWSAGYTGQGESVGILDSGVRTNHPAFAGVSIVSQVFLTNGSQDSCFIDNAASPQDQEGHGTHVAGIVASQGSAGWTNYLGVAKGLGTLYNLKVAYKVPATAACDPSGALSDPRDVLAALDWAVSNTPLKIFNYSYGSPTTADDDGFAQAIDTYIDTYGLAITIAAGNLGPYNYTLTTPGIAYNSITVVNYITRTSVNRSSSVGPTVGFRYKPDLAAPGTNIFSAAYNWDAIPGTSDDFVSMTGTSMAAPHIAGALALLHSAGVTDPLAAKAVLLNSADGTLWADAEGSGPANLTTALGQLYYDHGSLAAGEVKLYRTTFSGQFRITALLNRHVSEGTSYLNNMSLSAYDAGSGGLVQRSDYYSGQNLQQLDGTQSTDVIVALTMLSSPLSGVSSEPFGIAFSNPWSAVAGPQLSPSCTVPGSIVSGAPFSMSCTVINTGDVAAISVTGQALLPSGFSGETQLSFGNVPPGSVSSATLNLTAPPAGGSYNVRLDVSTPPAFGLGALAGTTSSTASVDAALQAPALLSPANGAAGISQTPILNWTASGGATAYDVYIGTGTALALVGSTAGTTYTPASLNPGTLYSWQVVARNAAGSSASATWSFTIQTSDPMQPQYLIVTVAGNGTMGNSGDGGPATSAEFMSPGALAVDTHGNLFVTDGTAGVVRKVAADGTISTVASGMQYPEGVAVDASGNLYIAATSDWKVWKVSPGGVRTTFAGTGDQAYTGDGGPATSAALQGPEGVAVDGAGNVWIADPFSNVVRKVDSNGIITTVAGNGTDTGDGGPATGAQLAEPNALALDAADNLYISAGGRIRKVTAADGIITTIAGDGPGSPFGSGCPGTPSPLSHPYSVAVDAQVNLFVGEPSNCLVREFTPDAKAIIIAGNGASGYSGDGGLATSAQIDPTGVAVDASGVVYATDGDNERVRALLPLDPSCQYQLDRTMGTAPGTGGSVSITIQTGPACAWGIAGLPPWIGSTTFGKGSATVNVSVAPNSGVLRAATISIAGTAVTVMQGANSCTYSLSSSLGAAPLAGGTGSFTVTADPGCPWVTSSPVDWVTLTSSTSGIGSGTVNYSVAPNSGSARLATLNIAGLSFEVQQDGASGAGNGLRFVPVTPCRVVDTRGADGAFGGPTMTAGETRSFALPQSSCGIPATVQAYSLNVTVVPEGFLAYLSLWPTGQTQPTVSTLNSYDGSVVANAAIVPAGTGGAVSVYVYNPTDVILDINGYFDTSTGATSYSFYPATPCRVVDTRGATGSFGGPTMQANQTRSFPVPQSACDIPATAQAYSLNFTVVPQGFLGYLATWPTGQQQPNVSTLNSYDGSVVANAALVPAGTNEAISVFVTNPTDVIADINGYFGQPGSAGALSFYPVTPCRVADTRNANGAFGGPIMGAGETRSLAIPASACGIPSTAAAYSLNVTVVPDGALYYLSVWPTGVTQPQVSTLNSYDGSVLANAAIVPAGTNGAIDVYVTGQTHVILDINGYFAP